MPKVRMVKGPARVFVKGTCYVLGRNVSRQTVKVRSGKALPFEPTGICRLQAQLGPGAAMWWADPRQAGTYMWRSLAERVFALAAAKKKKTTNNSITTVMLVGDTDTGKSTLAIYLANMAIRRGLTASVIDGDIGQGDLAPPTAIGATILPKPIVDLRDVDVNTNLFEFVGNISPAGFEGLIAKKLGSMLDRTRPLADICIVNTDGYVRDGGVQYKEMIAEELQPDVVICLGYGNNNNNINNNNTTDVASGLFDGKEHMVGSWHILRARSSSQVYKSRLERINRRLDQFLRYVGSGLSIVNLAEVKFNYADKLFPPSELFEPSIKQLELENMKEMFVGLGSNGCVIGFGVIRNIDLGNSCIHIQTNIISSFDIIYLSNIRLSSDRVVEIWIT